MKRFAGLLVATMTVSPHALAQGGGLLPDLRTIVPLHLQIVNAHQRDILRFSNGIANTGPGHWRMRPRFPVSGTGTQDAIQEILDANGNVVQEAVVSQFEFHPEHNHWHIGNVAHFAVRSGSPTGAIYGSTSTKVTFCLIDWYRLDGNSNSPNRTYFECNAAYQGISSGWVDQYHQSTEGQQLDITGIPEGEYYLVSTCNPDGIFLESNTTNNTAWVRFRIKRQSQGNPKLEILGNSPCETPALCGEGAPNR
jgi:hypothetical protein